MKFIKNLHYTDYFKINYPYNALEPAISAETNSYHYENHYKKYVDNVKKLVCNTEFENLTLYQILIKSYGSFEDLPLYNNAAQALNHVIFWSSLSPLKNIISSHAEERIKKYFHSLDQFKTSFITKGVELFGNGWLWVIVNYDSSIEIISSVNAFNPFNIKTTQEIVFGIDLWEHAYYIDYRANKKDYITAVYDMLDWNNLNNIS